MLKSLRPASRGFAKFAPPPNSYPEGFLENEKKIFEERFTERQRTFLKARHLALLDVQSEDMKSNDLWWNRLKNMTDEELEIMPYSWTKKYGTFITSIMQAQERHKREQGAMFEDRYERIKNLDKLKTDAEK